MMKRFFAFYALMAVSVIALAQSLQPGFVKQYNERLAKTPLGGVALNVYGASSTVSDSKGAFTLRFNTLKAGDKVSCLAVEKNGYEIFNTEALKQWNISKDNRPFTIIMCRSEKFKAIKDKYSAIAHASYARQQKKEEADLKAELQAGRMKENEYRRELKELESYYQGQLKNIDTYVDRFSRIDESELSAIEQNIIDMVQKGDIDGAINMYEKQNFIGKYEKEIADVRSLRETKEELELLKQRKLLERDSLYSIISRQVDTYKLAGGIKNFEKMGKLLKEVADADTTFYLAVWNYAYFADNQLKYLEAIRYYRMFLGTDGTNIVRKSSVKGFIANAYCKAGRISEARRSIYEAISDEQTYLKLHPEESYETLGDLFNKLGLIQCSSGENGEEALKQALGIYMDLHEKNRADRSILLGLAETEGNLGNVYWESERLDSAITLEEYAHKHFVSLSVPDTAAYQMELGYSENNLGLLYGEKKEFEKAISWSLKALNRFLKEYDINPDAWTESVAMAERNLGSNYLDSGDTDNAAIHLNKALDMYEAMYAADSIAYRDDYAASLSSISRLKRAQKDYTGGASYAKFAYQVNPKKYNNYYSICLVDEAKFVYLAGAQYKTAIETLLLAVKYSPDVPYFYEVLGDVLLLLKQDDAARKAWEELKKVDPDYTKAYPNSNLNKKFNNP